MTIERSFAILPSRVKAVFIDTVVMVAAMFAVSEVFALFDNVPSNYRIIAFVLIFVLYDPFFTSKYGGTIGHTYSKICVKKATDFNANTSFPVAIVRFLLKSFLGWFSLLTTTGNEKKQAVHDFVANSVVLNVD